MSIAENLADVRMQISQACLRSGRALDDVTLVAVSKRKPIELVTEAVMAGQRVFGENYVQEILPKVEARPDLDWHFIGSLQTNKVKQVIGKASLIHSVDRAKLLVEIAKVAAQKGLRQRILLELNVGDEATKAGASRDDIFAMLDLAQEFSTTIDVCGLMALPPLFENEAPAREAFATVRSVFDEARGRLSLSAREPFRFLSMGTSGDFAWAIAEGATHVRVGTSIFGSRS